MTDQQIAKWIDQLQGELDTLKRTASGGGGSITPIVESGVKIADFEIGSSTGSLYAPDPVSVYSSEETVVGKWIDGRNVYRRVFHAPKTYSAGSYNLAGITIPNAVIINILGIDLDQGTQLGFYSFNQFNGRTVASTGAVEVMSLRSSSNVYVSDLIIEYFKTNESPSKAKGRKK